MTDTSLSGRAARLARYEEERDSAAATLRDIEHGWRYFEKLGYQPQIDTTDKQGDRARRTIALMNDLIAGESGG